MRSPILGVSAFLCLGLQAQHCTTDTAWAAFQPLLGTWSGQAEGEPGIGTVQRSVTPALDGAFLRVTDQGEFLPQEKNPKGERHADESFISFDHAQRVFRMKQFHQGGILNEFKVDSVSADGHTIILITERVENFMPGWRSRLTWIIDGDSWIEVFDVAPPNKKWMTYMRITLKRGPSR
jgi:hypothetical protein